MHTKFWVRCSGRCTKFKLRVYSLDQGESSTKETTERRLCAVFYFLSPNILACCDIHNYEPVCYDKEVLTLRRNVQIWCQL